MASFLEKIRLKSARRPSRQFDLSCQHLTTQNFNNLQPIYSRELIPGSKIDVDARTYSRFEPMPQPTFMSVDVHNRAFLVPYRTVFPNFDHFLVDTVAVTSSGAAHISMCPHFSLSTFFEAFFGRDDAFCLDQTLSSSTDDPWYNVSDYDRCDLKSEYVAVKLNYDVTVNPDSSQIYDIFCPHKVSDLPQPVAPANYVVDSAYVLSARGRYLLKVFESLGYRFDFSQRFLQSDYLNKPISALGILCYCKVIIDWYFPSQYAHATDLYNNITKLFQNQGSLNLSADDFINIFSLLTDYILPSDYFTAAFDNMSTPNADSQAVNYIRFREQNDKDVTSPSSYVQEVSTDSNGDGTPTLQYVDGSGNIQNKTKITAWGIEMLSRLSNYMKRNQFAGAKVIDRYLARFGVQLPAEKLNRSYYLGSDDFDVKFFDVTATNATDGDSLGQFAGKGSAGSSKSFSCSSDEFGLFIIINDVTPRISYTQGFDRFNHHVYATDFYTSEFDAIGMQSIKKSEIMSPRSSVDFGTPHFWYIYANAANQHYEDLIGFPESHFGFSPRYSEYKVAMDKVTGNFSYPSVNAGLDGWINSRLFRCFLPAQVAGSSVNLPWINTIKHSYEFCNDHGNQYLRLFYDTLNHQDNILMSHFFDVKFNAPMANLYDMFEFKNQEFGDELKLNVQGSKV